MEIRNLATFLQVAQRKNFTQAAEALSYSQSTVSSQIKQLEDEIGAPLFERIYNRVELTEHGKLLRSYAQEIINITEEINHLSSDADGTKALVRFAMAPSVCSRMMGNTFMNFHRLHPEIAVKIISAETDDMLQLLSHNDVDLIFIVDKHKFNKNLSIISERKVSMRFVAGRDYALPDKSGITLDELITHPFLLTEKGVSYRKLFDDKLAEKYLEITPIVEMGDTDLLLELVELGAGISYLPEYITQSAYESGKIRYIDVSDFEVDVWLQLICHKNKWLSPAIRKVSEYCSEMSMKI